MKILRQITFSKLRQVLGLGLVPAVAVSAGAAMSDNVRAEPIIKSLDDDAHNVRTSTEVELCQPIFGNVATEKQIGIPIIIEDEKGDALTSLNGLTFELIAANGDTQSLSTEGLVSDSTGQASSAQLEPVPQATIRAYETQSGTTLLPREIKWLNCSPVATEVSSQNGSFTPGPFTNGTKIVAKRNSSVIASGDLSGRQALNSSVVSLLENFHPVIYSNIDNLISPINNVGALNGCAVDRGEWSTLVVDVLGLQDVDTYYELWESQYCSDASAADYAFGVALSQLYYRDAPLGQLRDLPTQDLSVQAVLDIAAAGMREAVRLETTVVPAVTTTVAPTTTTTTIAPTTTNKKRVLPETGTDSNNIPVAIALLAGGAVLVVTRRRLMQQ
jgi:LPXTG-motif cell wall-anchored protein